VVVVVVVKDGDLNGCPRMGETFVRWFKA
jgi:hypothetical protein